MNLGGYPGKIIISVHDLWRNLLCIFQVTSFRLASSVLGVYSVQSRSTAGNQRVCNQQIPC